MKRSIIKPRVKSALLKRFSIGITLAAVLSTSTYYKVYAAETPYVSSTAVAGSFPLAVNGKPATIFTGAAEYEGVTLALKNLQTDVKAVTGNEPVLLTDKISG